ncbi:MAG: hypothetical protein AAGJ08_16155 [Cyanobacteria bacterium P01_H01_bin.35]
MVESKKIQNAKKITKVSSFAAIQECQITGSKSLHSMIEFNRGEIISKFSSKEILNIPNYLIVQISDRGALR